MTELLDNEQPTAQERFDAALAALTPQQSRFVVEYLRDLHQRHAAIRAGYSEKTADVQASRLLSLVKIRAAVDAGLHLKAMPADEVLARLSDVASGSMADFLRIDEEEITLSWSLLSLPTSEDGTVDMAGTMIKLVSEMNVTPTDRVLHTATIKRAVARLDLMEAGRRGKLGLIKKYALDEKGKVAIELYDAQAALQALAKHHGLLVERQEITGKDGGPVQFQAFTDALNAAYADDAPTTDDAVD